MECLLARPGRAVLLANSVGVEVDLVVYGRDAIWIIVVKNTANVRPEDLRPLKASLADYPECTPILLYRGRQRLHTEKIWCVPVDEFLGRLHPAQGLTAWLRR